MNTKEAILARLAHSGMPEHPMPISGAKGSMIR